MRRRTSAALLFAALLTFPSLAAGAHPSAPAAARFRLGDRTIAELSQPLDGQAPEVRARRAGEALSTAVAAGAQAVSVEAQGDRAVLRVGKLPVLELGPGDAAAAGQRDAAALASGLSGELERAVRDEAWRLAAQEAVFAWSMLVFSGLVALLLARRLGALAGALAERVESGELVLSGLWVGRLELASGPFLRGAVPLALRISRFVALLAVGYAWLLFAVSLFERTRSLGERLTRAVFDPAASVAAAVGGIVPQLLAAALLVALVGALLRASRRWFEALASGEATSSWFSRERARPSGTLVRAGIVVLALLIVPGVLGMGERGLGGLGWAVLVALGLGLSPIAATILLGVLAVYGGALHPGAEAEVGGRRGRVLEVTLREVVLQDEQGGVVRVPHLLTLLHPTRVERRP